jgi:hypothetical protein
MKANFRLYCFASPSLVALAKRAIPEADGPIATKIGWTEHLWEDRLRSLNFEAYAGQKDWEPIAFDAYYSSNRPDLVGLAAEGLLITDLLRQGAKQIDVQHPDGGRATEVFALCSVEQFAIAQVRVSAAIDRLGLASKVVRS